MDDGLISLKVVEIGKGHLLTRVLNNAKLGSKKGVNLPDVEVDLPALSEQDMKDIHFGVEQGVSVSVITNANVQYNIIVISSLIICKVKKSSSSRDVSKDNKMCNILIRSLKFAKLVFQSWKNSER